jgi:hypothetical protein
VVLLGTWSFAFYIVHWPVLVVLGSTLPKHFSVPGRVLLAVGALGLVLAAAAALHYVVEVPFERALRTPRPARATWAWRGSVPAFSGLLAVVAVAASAEAVVPVSTHGTRSGQAVVAQAVAPLAPSSVAKQGARPGPGQPSGPAGTSTAQGRQPPVQTGTNQPAKPASAPSSTTANPGSGPRSTPVTVPGVKLADCTASQLAQTITTDRPRYTAGQQVSIRLLALNKSTEPCVLAPPACYPEMTVVASASSLTWSIPFVDQGRCKQFSPVTLQPGQETSVVTSWDVNYCPTVAPAASTCRNAVTTVPAPPGSYQAQGLWLVDEAGGPTAVFIIS